jgi:hypothetical protein
VSVVLKLSGKYQFAKQQQQQQQHSAPEAYGTWRQITTLFTAISHLTELNEGCRGHQSDKRNPLERLNTSRPVLTYWERIPDTYRYD